MPPKFALDSLVEAAMDSLAGAIAASCICIRFPESRGSPQSCPPVALTLFHAHGSFRQRHDKLFHIPRIQAARHVHSPHTMAIPKAVTSVTVSPRASIYMLLHSIRHKNQAVHGLLLGRYDSTKVTTTVIEAAPVAHGAPPTQPLMETALGLIHLYCSSSSSGKSLPVAVVGWYTAPMLLEDRQPGLVALRIAAQLTSSSVESVLLVIQNQEVGNLVFNSTSSSSATTTSKCFQALGRDFGDQWLDSIATTVNPPDNIVGAVQKALQQGTLISDLVDHIEDGSATVISWFPNRDVEILADGL